jgi:hypothetical protein
MQPKGAFFSIDPASLRVSHITPPALSPLFKRVRYIRAVVAAFGLVGDEPTYADLTREYEEALPFHHRTLACAGHVADACVACDDLPTATALLKRIAASSG